MERRESFQERRKRQQARRRLFGKLAAVLIGLFFCLGCAKKTADQFLLTGEKKQDSYIGIEDAGHMVWLLQTVGRSSRHRRSQRQPMLRRSLTGIIHRRL